MRNVTNLGDLIATLYDEFLAVYQDEELASLATAATVNDLLATAAGASSSEVARASGGIEEAAA
jgi:hypothetical protein